ncbi:MAG: FadR family transcriptional regulator [Beijerinckiaceae bacterium]|nr:FadR family transcriptional regulator [Beijerinckiaceae bacterium]
MSPSNSLIDRNPSLADVLAQRLSEEIAAGQLKPGEKLPTEQQLGERFGVSRPIVREAIGRLKHDGLVVSRQGAGVFVVESGIPSVFRLQVSDFTDRDEIRGIIELLMAVESSATELAALRRTEQDLAAIQAQLDAMRACIERNDSGVDEDVAFHRAIVEATKNPFFRDLSDFLDRRVRTFIRTARANTAKQQDGMIRAVQEEHQAIFDAIHAQDAQAARKAAEDHLHRAAERLAIYLRR